MADGATDIATAAPLRTSDRLENLSDRSAVERQQERVRELQANGKDRRAEEAVAAKAALLEKHGEAMTYLVELMDEVWATNHDDERRADDPTPFAGYPILGCIRSTLRASLDMLNAKPVSGHHCFTNSLEWLRAHLRQYQETQVDTTQWKRMPEVVDSINMLLSEPDFMDDLKQANRAIGAAAADRSANFI